MMIASLTTLAGNTHLVLLHLPVGFLGAALLLEFWTRGDAAKGRLVEKMLAANAVAAVLAAAAGLVLAAQGDYPEAALGRHRWAGVACAAAAALAWWLRARKGVVAGRVGLGLLTAATVWAGHQGAGLTHGEGLFAWPETPAETEAVKVDAAGAAAEAAATATAFAVHPVIEKHCVECHGPKKQKGRLRLDTLAAAKKRGGGGEPALVAGDAEASELMRRIKLPRDDDEAMPPGERDGLSAAEKDQLAAWIEGLAR